MARDRQRVDRVRASVDEAMDELQALAAEGRQTLAKVEREIIEPIVAVKRRMVQRFPVLAKLIDDETGGPGNT